MKWLAVQHKSCWNQCRISDDFGVKEPRHSENILDEKYSLYRSTRLKGALGIEYKGVSIARI